MASSLSFPTFFSSFLPPEGEMKGLGLEALVVWRSHDFVLLSSGVISNRKTHVLLILVKKHSQE